ncbi:MAG: hypothetical protein ACE5HO_16875 [bacterium]
MKLKKKLTSNAFVILRVRISPPLDGLRIVKSLRSNMALTMDTVPDNNTCSARHCRRRDAPASFLPFFVLTAEPPPWSAEVLLQPSNGSKAQARLAHAKVEASLKRPLALFAAFPLHFSENF